MDDVTAKLAEALNAMLTHMGMDEDEWSKPTFEQAREALAAHEAAKPEPVAWLYDVDGVIAVELRQNDRYWQNQFAEYVKGQPLFAAPVAQAEFICRKCGLRQEGEKHAPDF